MNSSADSAVLCRCAGVAAWCATAQQTASWQTGRTTGQSATHITLGLGGMLLGIVIARLHELGEMQVKASDVQADFRED